MKPIWIICSLIFLPLFGHCQALNSTQLETLADELLTAYLEENYLDSAHIRQGNCVYGTDEGFTLSCITVDWDTHWTTDFDGDRIEDVVFQMMDEGLGGGGNAFGYWFEIVTRNSEGQIKQRHSLFGGGKFSRANLSIDSVYNGMLYTSYAQNNFGKLPEEETPDQYDTLTLVFSIYENELQESNYANCPLAAMNKNIFTDPPGFSVTRSRSLDDGFNVEQQENLLLPDGTKYYAAISGCEDLDLYFTQTIPFDPRANDTKTLVKTIWLEHLAFLQTHTRYKTVISALRERLSAQSVTKITPDAYGGFTFECTLDKGWKATLFISGNEDQGTFVTIRLLKLVEDSPLPFWESIKRKINE